MNALSKALRFEILARDGFACRYCGATSAEVKLHVDHIFPRAHGGSDDLDNLTTACADCNLGKSDRIILGPAVVHSLSSDKRPARLKKMRATKAAKSSNRHDLNYYKILDTDEHDSGTTSCLVWCETHETYEWHWISDDLVQAGGNISVAPRRFT